MTQTWALFFIAPSVPALSLWPRDRTFSRLRSSSRKTIFSVGRVSKISWLRLILTLTMLVGELELKCLDFLIQDRLRKFARSWVAKSGQIEALQSTVITILSPQHSGGEVSFSRFEDYAGAVKLWFPTTTTLGLDVNIRIHCKSVSSP